MAIVMVFAHVPVELMAETFGTDADTSYEFEYALGDNELGYGEYEDTEYSDYDSEYDDEYDLEYDDEYEEYEYLYAMYAFEGSVVASEGGAALYGATVSLMQGETTVLSVQTNYDGNFQIDAILFDVYQVDDLRLVATSEGFHPMYFWLTDYLTGDYADYGAPVTITFDFYLELVELGWDGAVRVSGVVTSAETSYIMEGVAVNLMSGDDIFTAETNEYGFFEILIAPAEEYALDILALLSGAVLTATFEGYVATVVELGTFIAYVDEFGNITVDLVMVAYNEIPEGMALVQGVVTLDGAPIHGASVYFNRNEETYYAEYDVVTFVAETDVYGKFSILVPAAEDAEYTVLAVFEHEVSVDIQMRAVSQIYELALNCGDKADLALELEWLTIRPAVMHNINNEADFVAFLNGTLGAQHDTFVLTRSLDMAGQAAQRGRGVSIAGMPLPFTGTFDGGGFTITGLQLRPSDAAEYALITADRNDFGFIRVAGGGAVIQNVTFVGLVYTDGTTVPGWNTVEGNIGLLIGRAIPGVAPIAIQNVNVTGTVTATGLRAFTNKRFGGMVGYVQTGTIVNVTNSNVNVTFTLSTTGTAPAGARWVESAGGIVGRSAGDVNVTNATVTMNTTIAGSGNARAFLHVGGVIGRMVGVASSADINTVTVGGTITAAQTGTTAATSAAAGGIIGSSIAIPQNSVVITNATVNASLTATGTNDTNAVGGIMGIAGGATITDSSVTGGITGSRDVGGVIGRTGGNMYIRDVSNLGGTITPGTGNAGRGVGGFIGRITTTGNVQLFNLTNTRTLSVPTGRHNPGHFGGLVGRNQGDVLIRNGNNIATIGLGATERDASGGFGGLVGYSRNADIRDSQNNAAITSRGHIGGIIGTTNAAAGNLTILYNVINNAPITVQALPNRSAGGLIGWSRCNTTIIVNSHNHGNVSRTGTSTTAANGGTVAGNVNNHLGGLIGRSDRALYITDGYRAGIGYGRSTNTAIISNQSQRMTRIGGLVGSVWGRTTIEGAVNYGAVTADAGAAGASRRHNRLYTLGGIIGWVQLNQAGAANRVLNINNVVNHGNVGPRTSSTNTGNLPVAGGIIGRVANVSGAQPTINITDTQNTGHLRAIRKVGGIIAEAQQPNITLTRTMNTGNLEIVSGSTSARRNDNAYGGLIGRIQRPNVRIFQSANQGDIFLQPGTGTANGARTGYGGVVGDIRATSGTVTIEQTYNSGRVAAGGTHATAGIVGRKHGRGTLVIRDVYNIGAVMRSGTGDGGRGGNGILGTFAGTAAAGSVRMYNVWNAGNVNGRPIAGENRADGRIRRISFQNVFFDSTTHTGLAQTAAGGLIAVPTDVLTRNHPDQQRPLLPGLNNPAIWMTGTYSRFQDREDEGAFLANTYPFFRWQTNGEIRTNFVTSITQTVDSEPRAVLDMPGTGSRTTNFGGIAHTTADANRLHLGTRIFNPYVARPTNAPAEALGHLPTTGTSQTVVQARTGLMSLGVINQDGIVAFDIMDRPDAVIVFAMDPLGFGEVDEYGDPVPALVTWSNFTYTDQHGAGPTPIQSFGGIVIYHPYYAGSIFGVTALGYAPESHVMTDANVVAGIVHIYLTRVYLPEIRVEIRNAGVEGEPVIQTGTAAGQSPAPGSSFRHGAAGSEITASGGTGAGRHFIIPAGTVMWGELFDARAINFYTETLNLIYYDIYNSAASPLVVRMYLEDLRIGSFVLTLVELVDADNDDGYITVNLLHGQGDRAGLGIAHGVNPGDWDYDEGHPVPRPFPRNPQYVQDMINFNVSHSFVGTVGAGTGHNITTPTEHTEFRAWALGFRTSELYTVGELFQFNDADPPVRLTTLTLEMQRVSNFNVRVYERIVIGVDQDTGEEDYILRLIPGATLTGDDEFHTIFPGMARASVNAARTASPAGTFLIEDVADGEEIVVYAPGFGEFTYNVNFEPIAEGGDMRTLGSNTALSLGDIDIILDREGEDFLIGFVFDARDPNNLVGIEGARVTAIDMNNNAVYVYSAYDGFFEFSSLSIGTHIVYGEHVNFDTNVSTPHPVVLAAGAGAVANVYLTGDGTNRYILFVRVVDGTTGEDITDATVTFNSVAIPPTVDGNIFHVLMARTNGPVIASATGFSTATVQVTDATWDGNRHAFVTVELFQAIEDLRVYVRDQAGNNLSAATLQRNGAAVTTRDGAAFILDAYVNDVLRGWAPGFVAVTRPVILADYDADYIVITLTEHEAIANMRVEVREGSVTGPLLPGASLAIAQLAPRSVTIAPNSDGSFTLTGARIGDEFTAGHPGFAPRNGTITVAHSQVQPTPTMVIVLGAGEDPFTPVDGILVRVVDSQDRLITTANLTSNPATGRTITPILNAGARTGTFTLSGAYIGDFLTASAYGFLNNVPHAITAANMVTPQGGTQPVITITLLPIPSDPGITLTVSVMRDSDGLLLPSATLTSVIPGITITPVWAVDGNNDPIVGTPSGVFTVSGITGENVGGVFDAIASGFSGGSRTLTFEDLTPANRDNIQVRLVGDQQVTLTVTVIDGINAPGVPFALSSLANNAGITMTPVVGTPGRWTMVVTGNDIGTILTGDAYGFGPVQHTIAPQDLVAPREIDIILDGNLPTGVRVNVVNQAGDLISTATLTHNTATIEPFGADAAEIAANRGAFATTVYATLVGTHFTAAAPGFTSVNHPITTQDMYDGVINIILGTGGTGQPPYQPVNVTVRVYRRITGQEDTLLPTAMLTFGGNQQGPASTFTLTLDGSNIGDTISAVAAGFAANTHTIVAGDLAGNPAVISIILGEYPGNGFEPVTVTVRVEDAANPGTPLESAQITPPAGVTATPVPNQPGVWTMTLYGHHIGAGITAQATGFATRNNVLITAEHLSTGQKTILLDVGTAVPVTVNVVDSQNRLVPTARLTHPSANITPATGTSSTFTAYLTPSMAANNTSLRAVADGFTAVYHPITLADINAGTITIRLGTGGTGNPQPPYEPVEVSVRVYRRINNHNELLPTAVLTLEGVTQAPANNPADGIFTVLLDGSNVGQTLSAVAAGFAANTHEITFDDLAEPRVITIILGEAPGNGFVPVYVTVRVENYNVPGTPLTGSSITLPTDATEISGANGLWEVRFDGRHIDASITAGALGFNHQSRAITAEELDAGLILFRLEAGTATLVTIRVKDSNGNFIPTAVVSHEIPDLVVQPSLTTQGEFTALITGPMNGSNFIARAVGFADVTHPIVDAYFLAPNLIIITMAELVDIADMEVRVVRYLRDASGAIVEVGGVRQTVPVSTAWLRRTAPATNFTGTNGVFDLDGQVRIGQTLQAGAPGFYGRTHQITPQDAAAGLIVINLSYSDDGAPDPNDPTDPGDPGSGYALITPLEVRVVRYQRDVNGNIVYVGGVRQTVLVTTATLSHDLTSFATAGSQGAGSFNLDGLVRINYSLAANAAGFYGRTHQITPEDAAAGLIIINLSYGDTGPGYQVINGLVVEVVNNATNARLTNATLTVNRTGATVTSNGNGTFTVNGVYINDVFTAGAPTFGTATHVINVYDAQRAANAAIPVDVTIGLTQVIMPPPPPPPPPTSILTVSNYPATVTPTGQTPTVGNHTLDVDSSVTLVAGHAATWTFLGWFRVANVPAAGTVVTVPTTNTRTIAIPSYNLHYVAVWGDQNGVVGQPNVPVLPLAPPTLITDEHIVYILGFTDGTVRPNQSMTRAEAAMIIFRLLEDTNKYVPAWPRFSDVGPLSWYSQAVNYLAQVGILRGYPDGAFRPHATITRAEFSAIMTRFFETQNIQAHSFTDVSDTHWAVHYINVAYSRDWVRGFGDGTFRPDHDITRAEAITIINRALGRVPNPETIRNSLDGHTVFTDLSSSHWAFYEIMEASVSHEFVIDTDGNEVWTWFELPQR